MGPEEPEPEPELKPQPQPALCSPPQRLLRVLTVGDGDLSYSLGLSRCFGSQQLELTATTLASEAELRATYARAAANLDELRARGGCVLGGVDATVLRDLPRVSYDAIIFNHPHLGLAVGPDCDEAAHARRHETLVAHFLHAARGLLAEPGGSIHLMLSGNQPHAWHLGDALSRAGLYCVEEGSPSRPPLQQASVLPSLMTPQPPQPGWAARRKYRNGSLGSRNWLGKYGYEHRRCESDAEMDVSGSVVFVLKKTDSIAQPVDARSHMQGMGPASGGVGIVSEDDDVGGPGEFRCAICGEQCGSEAALEAHRLAPALPVLLPARLLADRQARSTPDASAQKLTDHEQRREPTASRRPQLECLTNHIAVVWKPKHMRASGGYPGT
jgi:hypothetical protein